MGDLFDLANLITTVGVDAVKIKPEPGLPQKSSNEILTELFSTFDVPDDEEEEEDEEEDGEDSGTESSKADEGSGKSPKAPATEAGATPGPTAAVSVKREKEEEEAPDAPGESEKEERKEEEEEEGSGAKRKKSKKKHKHKSEGRDKEKKHKHKKKSKHDDQESPSDPEHEGSKKKKKKKKSKRKRDSDTNKELDSSEPKSKIKKLDKSSKDKSKRDKSKEKSNDIDNVKIKKEKDDKEEAKDTEKKVEEFPELPSVAKKLDDDPDELEVPKLLEKTKNPINCKIQIKDLKNSEVYNNVVKEIENKKKEKAERLEDGEISDSDEEDENRTPTLSPTPPLEHSGLRSDRKKYSSPSSRYTKKNDLRNVLKDKEKKKNADSNRSSSKSDRKGSNRSKDRDYRSRSCHSRDRRSRSRSGNRDRRGRGRSKERRSSRRGGGRDRDRLFRDDDRYGSKWRGRSRSRERKEHIEIDKKKLLEIARKNAISMIMKGKLPLAQQDKAIAAIQAGGKSIEELTDFCKNLSKSEAMGELSSISSGDESGSEKGFHHPFLLKERPNSIIMNIRDSKQLPTKTLLEKTTEATSQLRLQFPVSSGQHHRKNESEWIPVTTPKPSKNPKPEPKKLFVPAKELLHTIPQPLVVPPLQTLTNQAMAIQPMQAMSTVDPASIPIPQMPMPDQIPMPGQMPVPEQIPVPMTQPIQDQPVYQPPEEPVDISTIVSQRLAAMRKLSENPHDMQALSEMYKAQNGMKTWVESKQMPTGQFTGSTGANVLTPAELNSGPQAWVRKDQLLTAQPVSGGMGMALLQKMGWKPGEGLGKNKEGALEPLQLEIKLDKKGLVSDQDIGAAKLGKVPKVPVVTTTVKSLEGKHPVSLLGEYCSKRKFGAPVYELCYECGPDHKKNFIFKVKVNGVEYKPAVASPNKKLAKAEAAQVCLQNIGLLP